MSTIIFVVLGAFVAWFVFAYIDDCEYELREFLKSKKHK